MSVMHTSMLLFGLLNPLMSRDEFKVRLKEFNKSINIVLPNTKAIKYQSDFKLFNEIKLRAEMLFQMMMD